MSNFDDAFFRNSAERMERLRRQLSDDAIESLARDVVERLASQSSKKDRKDDNCPEPETITWLTDALITRDFHQAQTLMRRLQDRGVTLDVLYGRYLAAAAARLGMMWSEDSINFVQVTVGVGRIHELVNMLRRSLPPPRITHAEPVLFATVPGETHGLGVEMAAELFRQHGWDVHVLLGADQDDILHQVGQMKALVLGLSSGGRRTAAALARLVHAVRLSYPSVYIIVSGQIVTTEPDLIDLVQPDSTAATVDDALETIRTLSAVSV